MARFLWQFLTSLILALSWPALGAIAPASAATPCKAGNYAPLGVAPCKPCPAGTYTTNDRATRCTSCGPGSYCPPGSSAPQPCPTGAYTKDPARQCHPCPVGTTTSGPGAGTEAAACTYCPSASYWVGGACVACPKGRYAHKGATSASGCLAPIIHEAV